MNEEEKVTYFAETDARNQRLKFGIKSKDRTRHMYVIGKTGMGKSTLLENLAVQDIQNGNGLAFIDPHGKTADLLLEYIPEHRINDVVYFAPFDMEHPVSFNVMEDVGAERRHLVASGLMSAFKKIWVDAWSARMEYILGNIMLALLEYPGSTLIGVNRMLADKNFRNKVVDNITDPSVKSFWVDEYAKYTEKFAAEAAPAIQNKVGQFVANPLVRNIIGQPKSTFDIRKIMDEKKILIINLSKGRVGESNANLLGSMLITKIYLAAMSRADLNEKQLKEAPQFYLYVDEFQSFANESFADILSEARKYKLNLTVAHQYIEQMSEEVRAAVFGNVGTMVTFRVGAYDAEVLEKEFSPQFLATDIVNLQQYQMYLKLMIDGVSSQPFSATGMSPIAKPEKMYVQEIIDASRRNFAKPRYEVEDEIRRWHENPFTENPSASGAASSGGNTSGGSREGRDGNRDNRGSRDGGGQGGGERRSSDRQGGSSMQGGRDNAPRSNSSGRDNRDSRDNGGQPMISGGSRPERQGERQDRPRDVSRDNRDRNDRGDRNERSDRGDRGDRPTSDRPASGSKKDKENREAELRKAISLSYLKAEPDKKNDQKSGKPENIAALRDALITVMQDAKVDTSSMEAAIEQATSEDTPSTQSAAPSSVQHNQPQQIKPKTHINFKTAQPVSSNRPQSQVQNQESKQYQTQMSQPVVQPRAEEPVVEASAIHTPTQTTQTTQTQSTERDEQPIQSPRPTQQSTPVEPRFSQTTQTQPEPESPKKQTYQESAAHQTRRDPAEVPEEVLKKILNVQE